MIKLARPKDKVKRLLLGLSSFLLLVSGLARLGRFHWTADILALFPDTYFWLGFVLLLACLWKKTVWGSVIALLVLLLNGFLLLDYMPFKKPDLSLSPDLRLYVHNLYYLNDDLDAALKEIERYDPDIVFLMEYSEAIQEKIEARFTAYPYHLIEPSRFTMGLALFSRIPIENAVVRRFEQTRIPIFELSFKLQDQLLSFVGGHPWPPLGRWGQLHREQMAAITQVASELTHPLIVAGDFNASQWSYALGNLRATTATIDAEKGFGFRKSWRLNPFLKLPIDHVMVSKDLEILNFQHGSHGGSDHDPLIVDIALRKP